METSDRQCWWTLNTMDLPSTRQLRLIVLLPRSQAPSTAADFWSGSGSTDTAQEAGTVALSGITVDWYLNNGQPLFSLNMAIIYELQYHRASRNTYEACGSMWTSRFSMLQTQQRFQERGEETDSLYTNINASQPSQWINHDEATLFQTPPFPLAKTRGDGFCAAPSFERPGPGHDPRREAEGDQVRDPSPPWFDDLEVAFNEHAWVECEEEGPAAYIETWYIRGNTAYATEISRTVRLTQERQWWQSDIVERWQDFVDRGLPLHFLWAQPRPDPIAERFRLGHLILWHNPSPTLQPALLTIEFTSELQIRSGQAAALLPNPVTMPQVRDLIRLTRNCVGRICTLHHGPQAWDHNVPRPIPPEAGLHPQQRGLHLHGAHMVNAGIDTTDVDPPQLDDIPVQPPIEGESSFTRAIHEHWSRHAALGPAHVERILHIQTWYLEGRYVPFHDLKREVTLGEDFWNWKVLSFNDGEASFRMTGRLTSRSSPQHRQRHHPLMRSMSLCTRTSVILTTQVW